MSDLKLLYKGHYSKSAQEKVDSLIACAYAVVEFATWAAAQTVSKSAGGLSLFKPRLFNGDVSRLAANGQPL